jgi:pSer/pThr/pTyr-binding forkhead associated (FHA) protein
LGRRIEVDRELVIGRLDADVTIEDDELSRRHLAVRPVPGALEVEDLGSTNGTFVDSSRIGAPTRLHEGASVKLGSTVLVVEAEVAGFDPPGSRRGGLASRSWLPVAMSFGSVIVTAIALMVYFASR